MRILITAGGTAERIDDVRSITNHATGTLGAKLADMFAGFGHEVILLTTKKSVKPKHKNIRIKYATDVESVEKTVLNLLENFVFNAIIHSMAIGDYQIEKMTNEKDEELLNVHKISSKNRLQIILKPAPKIIKYFKEKQPNSLLVGFKLLSEVSDEVLYETTYHALKVNRCDFIFANDLKNVSIMSHAGFLIDKQGNTFNAKNKYEVANLIYEKVKETL